MARGKAPRTVPAPPPPSSPCPSPPARCPASAPSAAAGTPQCLWLPAPHPPRDAPWADRESRLQGYADEGKVGGVKDGPCVLGAGVQVGMQGTDVVG